MPTEKVLYEVADSGVATITLNDPDTRNALSAELLGGLIEAFERARDEEAVRCVVLASSHERTFSSGANLGGFAADEALAAGIVNRVVPDGELDGAVEEWALKLASKSPVIMRLGKEAMRRQMDMPLDDALDYLRAQLTLAQSTEDIVEGVTAFFEKREPTWKGR